MTLIYHFVPNCGNFPVRLGTALTTIRRDPHGQVHSTGRRYRRRTHGANLGAPACSSWHLIDLSRKERPASGTSCRLHTKPAYDGSLSRNRRRLPNHAPRPKRLRAGLHQLGDVVGGSRTRPLLCHAGGSPLAPRSEEHTYEL